MDTMDYIDEMIRENKDGRFEVISTMLIFGSARILCVTDFILWISG